MHSYGGQVGTGAFHGLGLTTRSAAGRSGRISHLVYMTAYALTPGVATTDKVAEFGHADLVPIAFGFAEDGTCVSADPKKLVMGSGSYTEAELEEYVRTFVRWKGRVMYEPLEHCAWREISVAYVYTTANMTVPHEYQKSFAEGIEKEGLKVRTYELVTGRCPKFTATQGVVDAINEVVSG